MEEEEEEEETIELGTNLKIEKYNISLENKSQSLRQAFCLLSSQ